MQKMPGCEYLKRELKKVCKNCPFFILLKIMDKQSDWIEAGRTAGAYGVKGWVRVVPGARNGDLLFETDCWWYLPYPRRAGVAPRALHVLELKPHGKDFIARIREIAVREDAQALKGTLFVSRSDLPELAEGEYYDEDLPGLTVKNTAGEVLGTVLGVTDNGAQDLLAVESVEGRSVFYIPMVPVYVLEIDFDGETVTVDWALDWN